VAAGWEAPSGSAVHDSARSLDPWAIAPRAGLAFALAGLLAIGWAVLAPMYAGERVPALLAGFYFPSRWTPLGGLLAVMAFGASKRCFGFGWPTALGLVLGVALPLALASFLDPLSILRIAVVLAFLGLVLPSPIGRFRFWAATAVGSLGVTLVVVAALGWTLDPMPFDPIGVQLPIAASWATGAFGVVGGGLIAFTARRGRPESPRALDSGEPPG